MRRRLHAWALLGYAFTIPLASAQAPDLSGTWKIDRGASKIDAGGSYAGLGKSAGVPATLYVTHARNGTVIVGSDVNTSHARTYRPGAASTSPLPAGGDMAMRSRWDERRLVAEGRDDSSHSRLEEILSLDDEGRRLAIRITWTTPDGNRTAALVYTRSEREAPCKQWPTPCKDW
ncbi:MAG: hypothetical protein VYE73_04840 [Acidobacteriota bacterium]|nr:hypothetical protein [Acidobacteriota bacterium]